jgi:hypothetical protein
MRRIYTKIQNLSSQGSYVLPHKDTWNQNEPILAIQSCISFFLFLVLEMMALFVLSYNWSWRLDWQTAKQVSTNLPLDFQRDCSEKGHCSTALIEPSFSFIIQHA